MKLKPLKDKILVQVVLNDPILKGGILLPDSHNNNKKEKGVVIEIGDKVEDVKKGDIILLPRYMGQNIELEGQEYYVIKESEVIAVIGENNG